MILHVLWAISVGLWLLVFVGYPIYTKLLHYANFVWYEYSIALCLLALVVCVITLIIQLMTHRKGKEI